MEKELENISGEDTLETSVEMPETEEVQVSAPVEVTEVKVQETVQIKVTKKVLQGKVVSNKPDKTIIIKVERQVSHPIYKKYYKKTKKFMAHDERNDCNVGDVVKIRECRPLSARKSWEMVEIVERAK